jgi:hypothetical protein
VIAAASPRLRAHDRDEALARGADDAQARRVRPRLRQRADRQPGAGHPARGRGRRRAPRAAARGPTRLRARGRRRRLGGALVAAVLDHRGRPSSRSSSTARAARGSSSGCSSCATRGRGSRSTGAGPRRPSPTASSSPGSSCCRSGSTTPPRAARTSTTGITDPAGPRAAAPLARGARRRDRRRRAPVRRRRRVGVEAQPLQRAARGATLAAWAVARNPEPEAAPFVVFALGSAVRAGVRRGCRHARNVTHHPRTALRIERNAPDRACHTVRNAPTHALRTVRNAMQETMRYVRFVTPCRKRCVTYGS